MRSGDMAVARRGSVCPVLLALCAAAVSAFSPSQDSELTFLLAAGASECFYQSAQKNGSLEVEYQVPAAPKPTPAVRPPHIRSRALDRV